MRDAHHYLAEESREAPVCVERESKVAGLRREPLHGLLVEPEVQDGVHHSRHREGRARADGDEQRVLVVAEPLSGLRLDGAQAVYDLLPHPFGEVLAVRVVGVADFGRDDETGRDGQARARHVGESRALAAEKCALASVAFLEKINPLVRLIL